MTAVERMKEGCTHITVAEECVDEFEIADSDLIELQAFSSFVEADAVDVIELRLLGVAGVMKDGPGG